METIDEYPSRTGSEFKILERKDPVVYCDKAISRGPLTTAQLEQYDRDGFLFFEGLFSQDEVAVFRDELEELARNDEVRNAPACITEPGSGEVRSIFNITRVSQVFFTLSRDARILEPARQILDDNVYFHQTRINYKPGFAGKEFQWHSDFETWHVEDGVPRMRALSCSILLTENNEFNGSLMVIPGSHRYYVSCAGETPDDNFLSSLKAQEVGVPDEASLRFLVERGGGIRGTQGPAGSVLLFDCNLMHGSNSNISPFPRSNVFFVFNSVNNLPVEPFCGKASRPDFLAARDDYTPVSPVSVEPSYSALQTM